MTGPRYGMLTKSELLQWVAAIRSLHGQNTHFPYYCVHCRRPYPCATVRILNGEATS